MRSFKLKMHQIHFWLEVIGGGYQGLGGLSPQNLQPNMAVIRNAEAAL